MQWVIGYIMLCALLLIPKTTYTHNEPIYDKYFYSHFNVINSILPDKEQSLKITEYVLKAEEYYDIPAMLLISIIYVESTMRPKVKSKKGCIGLMQINPKIWLDKKNERSLINSGIVSKRKDLYNIHTNIYAGAYILNVYMEKNNNNVVAALNNYNGDSSGAYSDKVISILKNLNKEANYEYLK